MDATNRHHSPAMPSHPRSTCLSLITARLQRMFVCVCACAADGRTLLVACPMPPKPRLAQLLTAPEKEALKRRGFRAVIAMKD